LKNSISTGFKLFTTIKKGITVKLSSRQAGKQAELSKVEAKLMHNTKLHHVQHDYRSQHG